MKLSLLPEIVLCKITPSRLISCLVCLVVVGWVSPAFAQEAMPSVLPAGTSDMPIAVQPPLSAEIAELRAQYRQEVEHYRSLERQSTVANQQYQQLKTLVSLETAVSSLKKTMQSRVKVLDLYFTVLRLQLTDATGVEISAKEQLLKDIDQTLIRLSEHRVKVDAATDRDQLNAVGLEFAPQAEVMETLAYQVQGQLTLSRLQTVYDKAQLTKQAVKEQTESQVSPLQRPARDRAFAETDRNLDDVRAELTAAQQSMTQNTNLARGSYNSLLKKADSIFAGLAQSINFLSELVGL